MRIAHALLVHNNPEQVARLVRAIKRPGDLLYINIFRVDSIDEYAWKEAIHGGEDVKLSFKYGPSHGSLGLVAATLDAMHWSLGRGASYFINHTGQCYPIKSRNELERILGESRASFIDARILPCEDWPACADLSRFDHIYFRIPGRNAWRIIRGRKPGDKGGFRRIPRFWPSLVDSTTFFGGSAYFALKGSHVEYLLEFLESNHAYRRFFRTTHVPDEHFFQTILLNSPCRNEIIPKGLTYADWRPWRGSGPRILTSDDYGELKNSDRLFARKFDPDVDESVLDRIDRELLEL